MKQFQNKLEYFFFFINIFLSVFALFLVVFIAFSKGLNWDEIEHLYSSFMVWNNNMPYRDFFQHHHPLLWYAFLPIMAVYHNSAYLYDIGRAFALCCLAGTVYYSIQILGLYWEKYKAAFVFILLYLPTIIVMASGTEFRPDNLMIFLFIAGLYYFLLYQVKKKQYFLNLSFVLWTFSFFALQKILLIFIWIIVILLYQLHTKKISWICLLKALSLPLLISGVFIFFFLLTGAFKDYFELNFLLNAEIVQYLKKMGIKYSFSYSQLLFLIGGFLCACCHLFVLKKSKIKIISFILIGMFVVFQCIPKPYIHYYLPFYPLVCIVYAATILPFYSKRYIQILFLIYAALSLSQIFLFLPQCNGLEQRRKILRYVVENTKPQDFVVDENYFNVNRPNLAGYYWYSRFLAMHLDIQYFNRHPKPNVQTLIKEKKPKIVFNFPEMDCRQAVFPNCPIVEIFDLEFFYKNYIFLNEERLLISKEIY